MLPINENLTAFIRDRATDDTNTRGKALITASRSAFAELRRTHTVPEAELPFEIDVVSKAGVPIRYYRNDTPGLLPVVIFIHGGGWIQGSIDDYDPFCRRVARSSQLLVASVGYRLAPEHPFPDGLEDCLGALDTVAEASEAYGGDSTNIAVMGDSAGGNLAALVCSRTLDRHGPAISRQVLIYPVMDYDLDRSSYVDYGQGCMLTRDQLAWIWELYVPDRNARDSASPLRTGVRPNLPPTMLIAAEFDPLRSEGEAYSAALTTAGVAVEYRLGRGMIHDYLMLNTIVPDRSDHALSMILEFLTHQPHREPRHRITPPSPRA